MQISHVIPIWYVLVQYMKCARQKEPAKLLNNETAHLESICSWHVVLRRFEQLQQDVAVLRFCDSGCGRAGFGGSVSATTDGTGGAGGSCGASEGSPWPRVTSPLAMKHEMCRKNPYLPIWEM